MLRSFLALTPGLLLWCAVVGCSGVGDGNNNRSADGGVGNIGDDNADGGVDPPPPPPPPLPPPFATSTKNRVAWKRVRALESDLLAGLSLARGELCNELGLYSCIDLVHLVPLGGNEPFSRSQYEPLPSPTVTTPIALDRVTLSACRARVDKDIAGPALIFGSLDFAASAVSAAAAAAALDLLGTRLLARRLTAAELAAFGALTVDDAGAPVSPRDFAILSCFAVATLSETIFY